MWKWYSKARKSTPSLKAQVLVRCLRLYQPRHLRCAYACIVVQITVEPKKSLCRSCRLNSASIAVYAFLVYRRFLAQNGLTCIENLDSCPDLVILDLSENSISRIEGLEKLKRLSSLKISRNKLTSLSVSRMLLGSSCIGS